MIQETNLALELRLGNLVLDTNAQRFEPNANPYVRVTLHNLENLERNFRDKKSSSLVGIPLSSDILLKAGFEKTDSTFYTFVNGNYDCWPIAGEGYYAFRHNGNLLTYVQYTHHLQNIMHALTGTELKIDL